MTTPWQVVVVELHCAQCSGITVEGSVSAPAKRMTAAASSAPARLQAILSGTRSVTRLTSNAELCSVRSQLEAEMGMSHTLCSILKVTNGATG